MKEICRSLNRDFFMERFPPGQGRPNWNFSANRRLKIGERIIRGAAAKAPLASFHPIKVG
jgi:hypothetical protein